MSISVRELRTKKNQLLTDMQAIALKGFDVTNRSAYDKMSQELEGIEAAIQIEERLAESRSFQRSAGRGAIGATEDRKAEFGKALRHWARYGEIKEEYRSILTTDSGGAGGAALIPQEFEGVLHESLKLIGPVAAKVQQRRTENGSPLKIVLSDDTGNGFSLLSTEGTSSPGEVDPALASKILGADTVSTGLIKVSFQELEDSYFDLDTFIRTKFAIRNARGLEKAVTLGQDSAGNALPSFPDSLVSTAAVGTTTATLADGIKWADLVALIGSVDVAYQANASFVMSPAIRSLLLQVTDTLGRPLYTADPTQDDAFGKLLGFPVVLNSVLPTSYAANGTPVLFGDLSASYLLRTAGQFHVVRLNERWADQLLIGFFGYGRYAGCSLVSSGAPTPLSKLKLAAS